MDGGFGLAGDEVFYSDISGFADSPYAGSFPLFAQGCSRRAARTDQRNHNERVYKVQPHGVTSDSVFLPMQATTFRSLAPAGSANRRRADTKVVNGTAPAPRTSFREETDRPASAFSTWLGAGGGTFRVDPIDRSGLIVYSPTPLGASTRLEAPMSWKTATMFAVAAAIISASSCRICILVPRLGIGQ